MIKKGIHPSATLECLGEAEIPETTILEPQAVIYTGPESRLVVGEMFIMYPNSSIRIDKGWLEIGVEASLGPGTHIYEPRAGMSIGNNVLIAGGCLFSGTSHGIEANGVPMRKQPFSAKPILIEDDVWIGMNCTVLPGVTIGRGAVVGAGSLVSKDLPPAMICYGSPCQPVRPRPSGTIVA